jgi:hypothetical protein
LCALPILMQALRFVFLPLHGGPPSLAEDTRIFAIVFRFMLRGVIFFGCVAIFVHLFRGEVLQRTLHFYFLAPVRRPVLLLGKYFAGVLAAASAFCTTTAVCYWLTYLPSGEQGREFLWHGAGFTQGLQYVGIALLASLGYGAVFLALGLFVRNPMFPVAAILGWESMSFLLPPLLKRFSVLFYLQSLCPVHVSDGPLAFPAEPMAPELAVLGVLLVAGVLLFLAGRRVRRFEVLYGED